MYKCKYFKLQELIPEREYKDLEEFDRLSIGWWFLDDRALRCLDLLREEFGTVIVNTWLWGGRNNFCGWRPQDCKIGAQYSQHKWGRAFDCTFVNVTSDVVSEYIIYMRKDKIMLNSIKWLKAYDAKDGGHLHFDVRNS